MKYMIAILFCWALASASRAGDQLAAQELADVFRETCAIRAKMGKAMAIKGQGGWLFLRKELRHIGVGKFWGPDAAKVSLATNREIADPLEAIVDYHAECKKNGIELIVVPVPPKAIIYPDQIVPAIYAKQKQPLRLDTYHQEFYALLKEKGVNVVDLTAAFLQGRTAKSGDMYCKQDTHYSGKACVLAAKVLGQQIKEMAWYKEAPKTKLTTEKHKVEIEGDLLPALNNRRTARETLTLTQVQSATGTPVTTDSKSPVLLLGDSHCLVFHVGGDMHAKASGLAGHLAKQLQMGIDDLGVRGSGARAARIALYKRAKKSGYLKRKKVIIWCFTARDFTESDGWGKIPLKR